MSGQLVWECVKKNNSFLRKGLHGVCFSAEAGNLYNSHSYKYSGALSRCPPRPHSRMGRAWCIRRSLRPRFPLHAARRAGCVEMFSLPHVRCQRAAPAVPRITVQHRQQQASGAAVVPPTWRGVVLQCDVYRFSGLVC